MSQQAADSATDSWRAPVTRTDDLVETLHGVQVADPYRWLESIDEPEVAEWVGEQNQVTNQWLAEQATTRGEIRARLEQLSQVTEWGAAVQRGGRWFASRLDAGADQPVLVVLDSPEETGRVLIDPADWTVADATATVASWQPSPDGRLLAYARSDAGSDWMTWRVRDVQTGEDLPDELRWSKFSEASWLASGDGFIYAAYDTPPLGVDPTTAVVDFPRITLHKLGDQQTRDLVLHREADRELIPWSEVSDDGRWLIISVSRGTRQENLVRVVDLTSTGGLPVDLVPELTAANVVLGSRGNEFLLLTDDTAATQRIVAIDINDPSRTRREVVAAGSDRILEARLAGGRILCHVLSDASSRLLIHDSDGGAPREVDLPAATTVTAIAARDDSPLVGLTLVNFTGRSTDWLLDLDTGSLRGLHPRVAGPSAPALPPGVEVVVERATAPSTDGTQVPLFLVHRSDVTPTGDVPTLLYGYGGFDIPVTPTYKAEWQVWVERGGLLAVANLRGGGEFGREWYDDGRRERKQHVFDDAIGCARWLASGGWSRPERIAITGRSNGGLLAAACLTQAPDAFGAAVPEVGVLDLYRFHRFTIGWAWTSDYGDPEVAEEFEWVRGYSPLHRIEAGRHYPPTLITTGDHDDRVLPAHSYKFAAALQAAQGGDAPILLRIDTAAGHGVGKPVAKLMDERADVYGFIEAALGRSAG